MNAETISSRLRFIVLLLVALVVASGCAPIRTGVAWPALAAVTIQGQPRVMVTFNNWAVALDPATGTPAELLDARGNVRLDERNQPRRWIIDGNANNLGAQFFSRPLFRDVEGAEMILPTHNRKLLMVDVEAARVDNPAGQPVAAPIVADVAADENFFFVPFETGGIAALYRDDLSVAWTYHTDGGVWAAPVVVDGVVYFGTTNHLVYALDVDDGRPVWNEPTNTEGLIGGSPLVANGFVYVGNTLDRLLKIDADTGEIVREAQLRSWLWSQPVLVDDVLYTADLSGFVYAIDPETLEIIWETQAAQRGIRPAPLVTENHVIVASRDGIVHWLTRDGREVFERQVEGAPEILGELLYIPENVEAGINESLVLVSTVRLSHLVVAFSEVNGSQRWVHAR